MELGVNRLLNYIGYFFVYSFAGFLLETLFALFVQGEFVMRKCFLLSPLCPVYGLGAIVIISFAGPFRQHPAAVFLIGLLAASVVEYFTDIFYREILGVTFWDYTDMPMNINGRVCLVFSLIWGVLSLVLVRFLHPAVERAVKSAPRALLIACLVFFCLDAVISVVLLGRYKTKSAISLSFVKKLILN